MDIRTFKKIINDILVPYGFKKTGTNSWIRKGDEISTKVYLQKSSYSCLYYFDYYYVINNMLTDRKGYNETIADINYSDFKLLHKMCDLEYDVSDEERTKTLQNIINQDLSCHKFIETEVELKEMIIKRDWAEFIVLKEYLGINLSIGSGKKNRTM